MAKKSSRNTKARIVSAAWKLFYEQGYEETTVEEIIFESETSKGSFYHYFDGKDALLSSLSVLFDERYEELMQQHLLDRKRTYYRLLRQIVSQGQEREELTDTRTVSEIVKAYSMFERGLMYDWCLSGGEYSLVQYAREMMPLFLDGFRKK